MSDNPPSTVPPTMDPGGFGAPPQPTSNGLAIAALVLGIAGMLMCPLLGIAAIVMGIIVIGRTNREPQRYGGQGMAIGGLVCGGVSMLWFVFMLPLMISILLPSLSRARELAKRSACAANLKGIGTSVKIYENDFPGQGMPTFDMLIARGDVTPQQLVCPSSGGTQGYIFSTPADDAPIDNRTPIAWEPLSNHAGEGGNVLYADGHVEFLRTPEFEAAIAQAQQRDP